MRWRRAVNGLHCIVWDYLHKKGAVGGAICYWVQYQLADGAVDGVSGVHDAGAISCKTQK